MPPTPNTQPPAPEIERRYVSIAAGAELRAEGDGELPRLSGVACPWDSLSVELWRDWSTNKPVRERFLRGAFADVLAKNPDIIVPRDHNPTHLLGRTSSGTASVFESERGLEYWVDPAPTEDGRTVVALARRGDITGSSFAFISSTVEWEERADVIIRTVKKVKELYDVSPVTNPAYPESSVSTARSLDAIQHELEAWRSGATAWKRHLREREALLHEAGL